MAIRREPVPAAYRVFFRHIGLDPDVVRTPIEAAVLERMLRGGFLTGGLLEDVLLIALVDTGVPVWALDAERRRRPARHPREPRGRAAGALRGRAAAAGRPAGGRRRLGGARDPVRRARAGARGRAPARAALTLFAIQVAGRAVAVRGRGAVDAAARRSTAR